MRAASAICGCYSTSGRTGRAALICTALRSECKVEFYWQFMPGEAQDEVEREFFEWLDTVVRSAPELFPERPHVAFPIRWMPGSAILKSEPLVRELAACAEGVLGAEPAIVGIEGPCDMFVGARLEDLELSVSSLSG